MLFVDDKTAQSFSQSGGLGAISIFMMLHPKFQGPQWRTFRLLVLVSTGLSGIAPIAHGIYMFGFPQMNLQSGLSYYLAEGGIFLLGAIIYAVSRPTLWYLADAFLKLIACRHESRSVSSQGCLIYGDLPTRSSMFLWCWLQ